MTDDEAEKKEKQREETLQAVFLKEWEKQKKIAERSPWERKAWPDYDLR